MQIKLLRTTEYPPDGTPWFSRDLAPPSWEDIATAIDHLDRDRFPFLSLFSNSNASHDELPDLTVMGGNGAFVVGLGDKFLFRELHSETQIDVWISDQGASFPENFVCYDIELVKEVVRYFAETGQHDPTQIWRSPI